MEKILVYRFDPDSRKQTPIAESDKPVSAGASVGQFLVLDATRITGKTIASSHQPVILSESRQGLIELKTLDVKELGELSLTEAMKRELGFYGYDPGFPEDVLRRAAAKRIALEALVGSPRETADLHAPYKPPVIKVESMDKFPGFKKIADGEDRITHVSDLFILRASNLGTKRLGDFEYDIKNKWWVGERFFPVAHGLS